MQSQISGLELGKEEKPKELMVLIPNVGWAGDAVQRREEFLGLLSLRIWDEHG